MKLSELFLGIMLILGLLLSSTNILAEGGIPGRELVVEKCVVQIGYFMSVDPNFLTSASLWGLAGQFAQIQRMEQEGKIIEVKKPKNVTVLRCNDPKYSFVGNIPIRIGPYCRVSFDDNPNKSPLWVYVKGIDCGENDYKLPKEENFLEEDKSHGI